MILVFLAALLAQTAAAAAPEPAPPAPIAARSGTPLRLMVWNEVSTRSARAGDRFLLLVDAPVMIDGRVAIPRGARAWGEVVAASASGMAGRAGKLETRLLYLETAAGQVPIAPAASVTLADKGRAGTLQVVLATAALTPWGPFARGNNARLKAGHIVEAVLAADIPTP